MRMNITNRTPVRDYSEAARLLGVIKNDNSRLDAVLELQRYLIRSITRCERSVRRLRRARGRLQRMKASKRLTRDRSRLLKGLVGRIDERIKDLHHEIFLWRCFGDGIAFIYQSKYALKHLFYNKDYIPKQGPGFISGKQGFRREYKMLRMGIRMNVPVVMSDLTNVIRHGDLCALADADPWPVEIKSSENRNLRAGRQVAEIGDILSFFANDGAKNFRGIGDTVRVEFAFPEESRQDDMNACLEQALQSGFSMVDAEEGLTYFAFTPEFAEQESELLEKRLSVKAGAHICTWLTPDQNWLPLYPFTLSLSSECLIPFIRRHLLVATLIDTKVVKRKFADLGVHAIFVMDGVHALQICLDPDDLMKGAFRVSEQLFARISCEFQSLDWFVKEQARAFVKASPPTNAIPPKGWDQLIDDWQKATCLFVDSN